jgi:hypothetical protein
MKGIGSASLLAWMVIQLLCQSERTHAFTIRISPNVEIRSAPLIGGPSWLPVHCQVIVDQTNVFDFVPLDATNPKVLQKLVTFQDVPAIARIRTKGKTSTSIMVDRAVAFCQEYDRDLHLLNNNCWAFAYELVSQITLQEEEDNEDNGR